MAKEEYEEQKAVVQYLELIGAKFTAIPNSTYTPSFKQMAINRASGLRAGFPDLFIIVNKKSFFIEMKKRKKGVVSDVQKLWHTALKEAGLDVYVCNGADEAIEVIRKYQLKK